MKTIAVIIGALFFVTGIAVIEYYLRDINDTLHRIEQQQKRFMYVDSSINLGGAQKTIISGSNLYVIKGDSNLTFDCKGRIISAK